MSQYEDIIHLPHHVSKTHPQMSIHDRAAQFSPFAALTGHSDASEETARLTMEEAVLDDNEVGELNRKLAYLKQQSNGIESICITWFQEDARKAGGEYLTATIGIKKIDENSQTLVLEDGTVIQMRHIRNLDIPHADS